MPRSISKYEQDLEKMVRGFFLARVRLTPTFIPLLKVWDLGFVASAFPRAEISRRFYSIHT